MKIKCPRCKHWSEDYEFDLPIIRKIHEKIELLNERKIIEEGEDIPFPDCTETVKKILKSLLDDKK